MPATTGLQAATWVRSNDKTTVRAPTSQPDAMVANTCTGPPTTTSACRRNRSPTVSSRSSVAGVSPGGAPPHQSTRCPRNARPAAAGAMRQSDRREHVNQHPHAASSRTRAPLGDADSTAAIDDPAVRESTASTRRMAKRTSGPAEPVQALWWTEDATWARRSPRRMPRPESSHGHAGVRTAEMLAERGLAAIGERPRRSPRHRHRDRASPPHRDQRATHSERSARARRASKATVWPDLGAPGQHDDGWSKPRGGAVACVRSEFVYAVHGGSGAGRTRVAAEIEYSSTQVSRRAPDVTGR